MKRIVTIVLALSLALVPALALTGCGDGWETVSSGGIAIDSVERDENGYIVESAAKDAALTMAEVFDEALCSTMVTELDQTSDPVKWVIDFDAEGTSYHYEVNAENGDLIDFTSFSF